MHARVLLTLVVLAGGLTEVPAGADGAMPGLKPCLGGTARCGSITVPLDRDDPAAGTIDIGFELHPRRDSSRPALEPIVATEGGPGFATSRSRDSYLDLFAPLRGRHDILLMDNRGTGRSGAIDCPRLQKYHGNYIEAVAVCGRQLGSTANLYGTAAATDDLADLLDALGMDRVDLYGDSYGTFFGQTFAVRHPDRLRALVLDAAYPVEAPDYWYRDTARAGRDAFRFTCARNATCASRPGDVVDRLGAVLDRVRTSPPVTGVGFDADGHPHAVTIGSDSLVALFLAAATSTVVYRELDAASRAFLGTGDAAPLFRMIAEATYYGPAGNVRAYSEGLYVAVACNDYPQAFDMSAPPGVRFDQFYASVAALAASDPDGFAPYTVQEVVSSPVGEFNSCIGWPKLDRAELPLPIPPGAAYPSIPVLVLAGDLDSLTSPEGAQLTAAHFPNSTYVEFANMTHVSALADYGHCAASIVLRFVTTLDAGDTSCSAGYAEVRMVDDFWRSAAEAPPATAAPGDGSTEADRRAVTATAVTVADVVARWWNMLGTEGVGFRGGTFTTHGLDQVRWQLQDVAFVDDLAVSGTISWDRATGAIAADVTLAGSSAGNVHVAWNDRAPASTATAAGTVGGHTVAATLPVP